MNKSGSSKNVEIPEFSSEELKDLKQIFDFLDVNDTQRIEPKLLKGAMLSQGFDTLSPSMYQLFADLDTQEIEKKGGITFEEFLKILSQKFGDNKSQEGIKNIFNLFIDNPGSQTITLDSLRKMSKELGENLSDEELEDMLNRVSNNSNGITYEEFYNIMKE